MSLLAVIEEIVVNIVAGYLVSKNAMHGSLFLESCLGCEASGRYFWKIFLPCVSKRRLHAPNHYGGFARLGPTFGAESEDGEAQDKYKEGYPGNHAHRSVLRRFRRQRHRNSLHYRQDDPGAFR